MKRATDGVQPTLSSVGPSTQNEPQATTVLGEAAAGPGPPVPVEPVQATLALEGTQPPQEQATIAMAGAPPPAASPGARGGGATREVGAALSRSLGIGHKFFLVAACLVVATIAGSVAVTAYRADIVAGRAVRAALAAVGGVWRSFRAEREVRLRTTLRTLADEPQTRALLAEHVTPETVKDWAGDKTTAIGASFLAVLDSRGAFRARSDKPVAEVAGRSVAHAMFVKEALAGRDDAALIREGRRIYLVAAAPVTSGEGDAARLEGVLFAGYPLETSSARALSAISGTDVTFVASVGKRGEPLVGEVIASTLSDPAAILAALAGPVTEALLARGEEIAPMDVSLGDSLIVTAFPLYTGSGDVIGALVASRSLRAAKEPFTQIQTTLLLVGLAALLCALPVTYYFGRRIAGPLVALASSAQAIGEGNLDVHVPEGGSDEVGVLARAFSRMLSELREKAELERFVASMGFSAQDLAKSRTGPIAVGDETPPRAGTVSAGLQAGRMLGGRYAIVGLLGRGGMASVWRARDRELDEDVALKVLRDEIVASDPRLLAQLKEEIRLARRVTHPNIVRIHDFGDLDGVRFISMELVAGPTLRSILDQHGAVSRTVALQIGRQVCRGLAAAHEAGVIHRDIKPANIIVAPNGVAKIMDFGIAFAQEKHDSLGAGGNVVGTPDYMSPEQIEGRSVDARADVYAVGVVLYEMFTGARPFRAATTLQVLTRVLTELPTPVRVLRPDLPQAVEALILKAIAKKPEDRFQSAAELSKALGYVSL